jgi:probable HAF family extracellular repeat protein
MSRFTHSRLAAGAAAVLAAAAVAGSTAAVATAGAVHSIPSASYHFRTLDNPQDPTFNQLLGINDKGTIVGYDGSGADAAHPNKGFRIPTPYKHFKAENFPGSVQTQVIAITNQGNTAGFWVDGKGNNHGFVEWNGVFQSVSDPLVGGAPKVNQLLGLNQHGIAVGFYNGKKGNSHAYEYNQATAKFTPIVVPGAVNTIATGINDHGDVVGIATTLSSTFGFLLKGGHLTEFEVPGSTNTQPFGVNNADEIVGAYFGGAGVMHGFTVTTPTAIATFRRVDDPNGVAGSTLVNGVNNLGQLVGFSTDAAGNTNGFLATP